MENSLSVIKNLKQAGFVVKNSNTIIGFINILDDGKHTFSVDSSKFNFDSGLIAGVLTTLKIVLLESANVQNETGKFLYKIVSTKNMPVNLTPLLKEHKNGATIPEFIAILEPYKYYVTCLLQKKNGFKIERKIIYNNEQTSLMFWETIFKSLSFENFKKNTLESFLEESESESKNENENEIEIESEIESENESENEIESESETTLKTEIKTTLETVIETKPEIESENESKIVTDEEYICEDKTKLGKEVNIDAINKVLSIDDMKAQLNNDYSFIDFDEKKFCQKIANKTDAVKINTVLNVYASWIATQNQIILKQDLKELFNDIIKINKLRYKYGNTFSVFDIILAPASTQ